MWSNIVNNFKEDLDEFVTTVRGDAGTIMQAASEKLKEVGLETGLSEDAGASSTFMLPEGFLIDGKEFYINTLDAPAFRNFCNQLDLAEREAEMDEVLTQNDSLAVLFQDIVPEPVSREQFFQRYFFYKHLQRIEQIRGETDMDDDEDMCSWGGDEDQDDEEEQSDVALDAAHGVVEEELSILKSKYKSVVELVDEIVQEGSLRTYTGGEDPCEKLKFIQASLRVRQGETTADRGGVAHAGAQDDTVEYTSEELSMLAPRDEEGVEDKVEGVEHKVESVEDKVESVEDKVESVEDKAQTIQDNSDVVQDETDSMQDETDAMQDETGAMQDETDAMQDETDVMVDKVTASLDDVHVENARKESDAEVDVIVNTEKQVCEVAVTREEQVSGEIGQAKGDNKDDDTVAEWGDQDDGDWGDWE